MKRKLSFLLIVCMIFISVSSVNASEISSNEYTNKNGIKMTNEQVEALKNLGFNDYEIDYMDQEEFDSNKNLKGEVLSETTKYYKTTTYYPEETGMRTQLSLEPVSHSVEVSKEEYELGEPIVERGLTNGYTVTEYKAMTTTIVNPGNGNYRYKNTLNWRKKPAVFNYDIIGIGIESNKVYGVSSSKYIKAIHSYNSLNACFDKQVNTGTWSNSASGYSVKFELPFVAASVNYVTWTGLDVYMYFDVAKTNANDTITALNAYGNYRHATSNFANGTFSFSISVGGVISIGGSYDSKYDSISTAQATLTGINW